MSDPTAAAGPTPAEPASATPAKPLRPTRWVDRLSGLLLCVAAGGSLAAAAPALLRAAGIELAQAEAPPIEPRIAVPHPPAEILGNPGRFGEDDDGDEPRLTELERMYPDGMWPGRGQRRRVDRSHPLGIDQGGDPGVAPPADDPWIVPGGTSGGQRFGLAQKLLTLHVEPSESADATGQVKAGKLVMILKEVGDWALILYKGEGLMGWAKKSEIAVR
jgi:hypothetical protein